MTVRVMDKSKARVINSLSSALIKRLERFDPEAAEKLRNRIRNGRVYVLTPAERVLHEERIRTQYGEVVKRTHGLTTSYFVRGSREPVVQFITIPEASLFEHGPGNRLALKKKGLTTFVHEFFHVAMPGKFSSRLVEETAADIWTARTLLEAGMRKEAEVYLSGRKFTQRMRRRIIEQALARQRERYAARRTEWLRRLSEKKVKRRESLLRRLLGRRR